MVQVLAFIFPSELSSTLLTDGVCVTCCHDKINPIPCKTNLPDFIFPDGKKKKNKPLKLVQQFLASTGSDTPGTSAHICIMYILLPIIMIQIFTSQYFGIYLKIRY